MQSFLEAPPSPRTCRRPSVSLSRSSLARYLHEFGALRAECCIAFSQSLSYLLLDLYRKAILALKERQDQGQRT